MKRTILGIVFVCGALFVSAQTVHNGVWYSLYDDAEHSMNTQGDYAASGIFAPTKGTLNVQWRYEWIDWLGVARKIDTEVLESENGGSSTNKVGNLAENTDKNSHTTESFSISRNINWIKYNRTGLPTHKVIVYHQDIELAQHILLASGEYGATNGSHDFGDSEVQLASEAYHVNLRSFLSAGDITISSSLPEIFHVGSADNTTGLTYAVGVNACASVNGTASTASSTTLGKIANYGFDLYFTPQEGKTYNAVITITDGVSTAKINLSGKGIKRSQTIQWDLPQTMLSNETIPLAEASSGLEVAYTFSPEGIVRFENGEFVIDGDGVVTITASQEGNSMYFPANPLVKTVTIYPAEVTYAYEREICASDTYSDENFSGLTEGGIYCDTVPTMHGGDSIICLTLIAHPLYWLEESRSIRVGDSDTWENIFLGDLPIGDTTFVASYTSVYGCDSTMVLHLRVKPFIITYGNDTISLCAGESAVYEGKTYRRSTVDSVLVSAPNQFGGDSIVELVVNVYPALEVELSETIIAGDPQTWEGYELNQFEAGDTTLVAVYTSVHGCDSTYVLHLTVLPNTQAIETLDAIIEPTVQKILLHGQLFIRKGDDLFDPLGRKVE